MSRGFLSSLLLALLPAVVACGNGTRTPPDVLLITFDTTRADALGSYGGEPGVTPVLDRLAAEGVRFSDCRSVAPLTLPSHVSLFSGLYPPKHGVRDNGDFRLSEEADTLAERFTRAGYRSGAFVASYILGSEFGLDQGFETYRQPSLKTENSLRVRRIERRDAEEIVEDALAWTAQRDDRPLFLWVHFYDPHEPHNPPEPFRSQTSSAYLAEIRRADAALGQLLDGWRSGSPRNEIVVMTADHGESLGEHGEQTHGLLPYGATLSIPWIIRAPGRLEAGLVHEEPVSLVDIGPTLLALAGLPPWNDVDGRVRPNGSARAGLETQYAEAVQAARAYGWAPLRTARRGPWLMVEGARTELFDLENDPLETHDLSGTHTEVRDDLRRWLAAEADLWQQRYETTGAPTDSEALTRLRSLGYVSGGGTIATGNSDLPDPRDRADWHARFLDAQGAIFEGDPARARRLLVPLLAEEPQNPAVLTLSGKLAVEAGDLSAGLPRLEAAALASPETYHAQLSWADALHRAGRYADAEAVYGRALSIRPLAGEAHFGLARLLLAAGRPGDADTSFAEAETLLGERAEIFAGRGEAAQRRGDLPTAEQWFFRALAIDPLLSDAWNQIGVGRERRGDRAGAGRAYASALEARPDSAPASFNLGRLLLTEGKVEAARQTLNAAIARRGSYPLLYLLDAEIARAEGRPERSRSVLQEMLARPGIGAELERRAEQLLAMLEQGGA